MALKHTVIVKRALWYVSPFRTVEDACPYGYSLLSEPTLSVALRQFLLHKGTYKYEQSVNERNFQIFTLKIEKCEKMKIIFKKLQENLYTL